MNEQANFRASKEMGSTGLHESELQTSLFTFLSTLEYAQKIRIHSTFIWMISFTFSSIAICERKRGIYHPILNDILQH